MKVKPCLLLLTALLLAVIPARAETKAKPDDNRPALHVSVVESVSSPGNAYTDFDRFDLGLQREAAQRKWPVKINAERLAGNTPDYPTELRVTLQRVRREPIEDYIFRAWVILVIDGKKQDFGIVTYHYSGRLNQNPDDTYQNVFRGGAAAIADKIEPILFPELKTKK